MKRKKITQIFPFLLPMRIKQRQTCFFIKMYFDRNHYAKTIIKERFPFLLFTTKSSLYNKDTGFDMIYQENKVYNLKLASQKLNGLLINPQETFSLCLAIKDADKNAAYKEGLIVVNGKLTTTKGGGMCQLSNLLFWIFLHSPLTIVERHTHDVKDFPSPGIEGVDATISSGWLDLKVKNETDKTFQIVLDFDEENIIGSLYSNQEAECNYTIKNSDILYYYKSNDIYQKVSIYRNKVDVTSKAILSEELLYTNVCKIGYQLPEEIKKELKI